MTGVLRLLLSWSSFAVARWLLTPLSWGIRHLFRIFLVLGAVALTLGFVGTYQLLRQMDGGKGFTWANVLFFTFTLFLADATLFENLGTFPPVLEVARFLAPLATAAGIADAVGTLFTARWEARRSRLQRGHAVVCGSTTTARAVVDKLCDEGRIVVYASESASDDYPDGRRPASLLRVDGDPRLAATLQRCGAGRAEVVYACVDDSAANVSVSLNASRLVDASRQQPLRCIARVTDPSLVLALQARRVGLADDGRFRLDFFAVDQVGARALLDHHLPDWSGDVPPPVAIVGFTGFGQALLVELARRWSLLDGPRAQLPVTVFDPTAAVTLRAMRRRYATLARVAERAAFVDAGEYEALDFVDRLVTEGSNQDRPRYVYVCRDDDEVSLLTGLEVARALDVSRPRGDPGSTVVIKIGRRQSFEEAFAPMSRTETEHTSHRILDDVGGRLQFFPVDDEALPVDLGDSDLVERFARAVHERYLWHETSKGHQLGTRPALRDWEDLPDGLRDSNRAQASNYGEVLRRCGLTLMPSTSNSGRFEFSDDEVEALAEAEHQRWSRDKRRQGYRYGEVRIDEGPDKQHPSMVPWSELTAEDRDRDRDAVRNLPAVLKQADLQVLRLSDLDP